MSFQQWLRLTHPDVRLTTLQQHWAETKDRGDLALWVGGRASGKTFMLKLWQEYRRESIRSEHELFEEFRREQGLPPMNP